MQFKSQSTIRTMSFKAFLFMFFNVACTSNVPTEIDKLKKDFWDMEAEHFMLSDEKVPLLQKFFEFDQNNIQPISAKYLNPLLNTNDTSTETLRSYLEEIEKGYNKFLKIFRSYFATTSTSIILTDETKLKFSPRDSPFLANRVVKASLNDIYGILESVLDKVLKTQNQHWCVKGNGTSYHTALHQIYNAVALGEFKSYFMLRLQNVIDDRPVDDKRLLVKTKRIFLNATKGASKLRTEIRRCDPYRFIRDKNFLQFTKILQGYLKNTNGQGLLTQAAMENQCAGDQYIECMAISSSGKVCVSSFRHRRYDYIQQNQNLMGKSQYCSQSKLKRWNGEQELCLCDAHGNASDRYVSLRILRSDTQNNCVITGLRFVKSNRVLHLQIQEGKLQAYGSIVQESVKWVPFDDFKITDSGIYNEIDMYSITNSSRTMAIDQFVVQEDNYVVTGIGFQIIDKAVQLQATVTEYDYPTGKLKTSKTKILENKTEKRKYFTPKNADVPTYTDKPSELLYKAEPLYLIFSHTDPFKDVAQTTIPFFDAQDVTSYPARPLVGAGLFYKGREGYGGFIAPMIII